MKVFISSLISGFEQFRAAARAAVVTLRHEPVMAEDFGALPSSPQIACLQGVRSADLVVLILGERYGSVQGASGVSPTHEEYLAARDAKPVLVFVQQGVTREPQQAKFIQEVQDWQGGLTRAGFTTAEELKDLVIRGLHDHQLANAAGPLDLAALNRAALDLLPVVGRNHQSSAVTLNVAIVGGPLQRILRPAELEDRTLAENIHRQALFGEPRLFDPAKGMSVQTGHTLSLEQDGGARIQLDERGVMLLRLSLQQRRERDQGFLPAIIEETVTKQLTAAFAFADWMLETIDPTQKLTHLAIAVSLPGGGFMAWRTQAEHDASPNKMNVGLGDQDRPPVQGDCPRPTLRMDARRLAEDYMVRLRRQWKSG